MTKEISVSMDKIMDAINHYIQFFGEEWGLEKDHPYMTVWNIEDGELSLVFKDIPRRKK